MNVFNLEVSECDTCCKQHCKVRDVTENKVEKYNVHFVSLKVSPY